MTTITVNEEILRKQAEKVLMGMKRKLRPIFKNYQQHREEILDKVAEELVRCKSDINFEPVFNEAIDWAVKELHCHHVDITWRINAIEAGVKKKGRKVLEAIPVQKGTRYANMKPSTMIKLSKNPVVSVKSQKSGTISKRILDCTEKEAREIISLNGELIDFLTVKPKRKNKLNKIRADEEIEINGEIGWLIKSRNLVILPPAI